MAETKLKEEWEKITLFQGVINGYNTSSSKVTFLSIMKRKKKFMPSQKQKHQWKQNKRTLSKFGEDLWLERILLMTSWWSFGLI